MPGQSPPPRQKRELPSDAADEGPVKVHSSRRKRAKAKAELAIKVFKVDRAETGRFPLLTLHEAVQHECVRRRLMLWGVRKMLNKEVRRCRRCCCLHRLRRC